MSKKLGLALVVLGFVFLALTGIRTISHPETWTHIALGQAGNASTDPISYTLGDQKWVNMHPLYNQLVFGLWSMGGAPLVTLVHVAVVLAAFILMLQFGREWGSPASRVMALLLAGWLLLPVFDPLPTAFFMLFTALFLTFLYRLKNFTALAIILLAVQVLWTNMHPSFLFGPFLVLFFALENWQETRSMSRTYIITPLTSRLLLLTGGTLLASLINPNLINLHRHVIANAGLLTGTDNLHWISLFSPYFSPALVSSVMVFALILGAAGLITLQKKLPAMITLLAILGAFLAVRSIGTLGLFAFLAFPFLILSVNALSEYLTRTVITVTKVKEEGLGRIKMVVVLLLLAISITSVVTGSAYARMGSASTFGLGAQKNAFSDGALEVIARDDFPAHALNLPMDGGYLSLHRPDRKIFCDSRTTFYGMEFYRSMNRALLGSSEDWKKLMVNYNPEAIIVNATWLESGALVKRLLRSKLWKMVYFDGTTVVLVRNKEEYATLIEDSSLIKNGLAKLEAARELYAAKGKGTPASLLGAGHIYLALNRSAEAEAVYSLLAKRAPYMAGAWIGLGEAKVLQKKGSEGIRHLEKAVKITPRSGRAWMSLYLTYRMKGDEDKARYAADRLQKFFRPEKASVETREEIEKKPKSTEVESLGQEEVGLPDELK